MRITILTLFPAMFDGPFRESIVKRAVEKGIVQVGLVNVRDYARDKHHIVDDYTFGGGPGMVMKPGPIFEAVEAARQSAPDEPAHVVLLTPQGRVFKQAMARELSRKRHLIFICGHYEGVDERVHEHLVDDEISLGDFIMTGGEPAAIAIVDAVVRLLPDALGDPESATTDTFSDGLLQYPQYTRPRVYRDWEVPPLLLSGNHEAIAKWRRRQSILRTLQRRPDLLGPAGVTPGETEKAWREEERDGGAAPT